MRRLTVLAATAITIGLAVPASAASPTEVGVVQNFGPPLAASCHNLEGIAVDPTGNIYAASFAFQPVANICVVNRRGVLVDVIPVPAGTAGVASLLAALLEPGQGLYVLDFANGASGNGRLLLVDPASHAVRVVASGFQAPNGLTQDRHRNIYISDSFQGVIFKVTPDGTTAIWKQDPRLTPQPGTGPPFGANGVAFDRNQEFLYVATTADAKIYRIPVLKDGTAGGLELFASREMVGGTPGKIQALPGYDRLIFDVPGEPYVNPTSAPPPAAQLPLEPPRVFAQGL